MGSGRSAALDKPPLDGCRGAEGGGSVLSQTSSHPCPTLPSCPQRNRKVAPLALSPLVLCMLIWVAGGTQDCRWTPVEAATPFPHPHPAEGRRVPTGALPSIPFYSWGHWKVEEIAQDDTATLLTLTSLVPQGLPLGDRGVQGQQEDSIHLDNPPLLLRGDKRKDLSWPSGMSQASREA